MPCWESFKSKFTNKEALIASLKKLFPGQTVELNAKVRGLMRNADIVLTGTGMYDVGFTRSSKVNASSTFDIQADWNGTKNWTGSAKQFESKLQQQYSVQVVRQEAQKLGAFITEEVQSDGTIELSITSYDE